MPITPQRRINAEHLSTFVVTINELEERTDIEFLADPTTDIERIIDVNQAGDDWNASQVFQPRFSGNIRPLRTRQCS